MKTVFTAGTESGVNIRTFMPKPPVKRDFYVEMPFTFVWTGPITA